MGIWLGAELERFVAAVRPVLRRQGILDCALALECGRGGGEVLDDCSGRMVNRQTKGTVSFNGRDIPPDHVLTRHEEVAHDAERIVTFGASRGLHTAAWNGSGRPAQLDGWMPVFVPF